MKKIILLVILITGFSLCSRAQLTYAQQYALKVAERMKDTLLLSSNQKAEIYNINIQISNQKANVWRQYTGVDSLIAIHLQQIENKRDSLYLPVIGEEKYSLYLNKKGKLLNNN